MPDIRNMRKERFAWVENEVAQDKTLSMRALGLYTLMVSYPPDWKYHLSHLAEQKSDSLYATKEAFKELLNAGLVMKKQARDEHNQFAGYEYHVIGITDKDESPSFEIPSTGIPSDGVPVDGESHTTKKQNTKKDITNKQNKETKFSLSEAQAQELLDTFNRHRGNMSEAKKLTDFRWQRFQRLVKRYGWEETRTMLEGATKDRAKDRWYGENNHSLDELLKEDRVVRYSEQWEANQPTEPAYNTNIEYRATMEYARRVREGQECTYEEVKAELEAE